MGSMCDFFREASYGQLDVDGTVYGSGGQVAGWYRAPNPKTYYTNGDFGFGNHPRNAQGLVEDVLEIASGDVDFSGYDVDGDGTVEALVLICAGSSQSYSGSDSGVAVTDITRDGDRVTARVSNSAGGADGGAQWLYNQRVVATYAHHIEQFAWVNVEGLGWRRLREGAADGVSNLFDMCNGAVANSWPMHVNVDAEYLYTAYLV